MGVLSNFYEKILRKLRIEKKDYPPESKRFKRKQSLTTKEIRERGRNFHTSSVVVRPRSNTEIVIERRRYSKSGVLNSVITEASHKKNEFSNPIQLVEKKHSRSESAPPLPIIISGKAETGPTHLSLVSTGSILAPTYRSRTASIKQPTIIRVTLE